MPYRTNEARKNYYQNNKEKILEKNRNWRQNNKEKIRENKKEYESRTDRKQKKKEKSKLEYLANKESILLKQKNRRLERKLIIDNIALKYGCKNCDCKWQGIFDPCQLTFHHFDPSIKETKVAKMHSWSIKKIIEEINKCVVLCRNCHPLADKKEIYIDETMLCKETLGEL